MYIGAGILAMPFAMAQTSLFWGLLLILFSGSAAALGLYFQGLCAAFVPPGRASFFSISLVTLPGLTVVFDAAIAVKCFGVGVSYLVIVAQLMPQVMRYILGEPVDSIESGNSKQHIHDLFQSKMFWVSAALIVAGPLSFARRLDSLKYTSVIALVAVGYLVVLVLVKFIVIVWTAHISPNGSGASDGSGNAQNSHIHVWAPASIPKLLSVLPVIVFAFTCHQNMFASINELVLMGEEGNHDHDHDETQAQDQDPEPQNKIQFLPSESTYIRIVSSSIYPAAFTYVAVGFAGYLTFGNNVSGNIMTMYNYSLSTIIGRIAIVILVLFSYPLQIHPCRASISNIVHWIIAYRKNKAKRNEERNGQEERVVVEEETSTTNNGQSEHTELLEEFLEPQVVKDSNPSGSSNSPSSHPSHHLVHSSPNIPTPLYILITSIILFLSFILAVKAKSLEIVLAFVGATGSTAISFILPSLFAYNILKKVNTRSKYSGYVSVEGNNTSSAGNSDETNENGNGNRVDTLQETNQQDQFERQVEEYHLSFYSSNFSSEQVQKMDKRRQAAALALCITGVGVLIVSLGINIWNLVKK